MWFRLRILNISNKESLQDVNVRYPLPYKKKKHHIMDEIAVDYHDDGNDNDNASLLVGKRQQQQATTKSTTILFGLPINPLLMNLFGVSPTRAGKVVKPWPHAGGNLPAFHLKRQGYQSNSRLKGSRPR